MITFLFMSTSPMTGVWTRMPPIWQQLSRLKSLLAGLKVGQDRNNTAFEL